MILRLEIYKIRYKVGRVKIVLSGKIVEYGARRCARDLLPELKARDRGKVFEKQRKHTLILSE